jgi:glycosyltransferase involved in cell wall biosynthesis
VFASFVGSLTHPIRDELIACYNGNTSYRFHFTPWTPHVSIGSLRFFLDTTVSSRFTLCPRGYGPASFRLYEAMQLGSVPVYISDNHVLPWSDELDWEEFCVVIDEKNITDLDATLINISDERYEYMRMRSRELYEDYFTLQGVTANILKRIEC